jgi:RNA polymerase sigma-70 factor (sigma-E family)
VAGVTTGKGPDVDDGAGFAGFVAGHAVELKRLAFLLTGRAVDAEDLLQNTLIKLYVAWPRVERVEDRLAYARRVLVHTHSGSRRRKWWGEEPSAAVGEVLGDRPGAVDETDRADDLLLLRQALGTLTARQRAVVVLRYYSDLSERDTATALGCSPGTVKTLASRGLERLRARLDAPPGEPLGPDGVGRKTTRKGSAR